MMTSKDCSRQKELRMQRPCVGGNIKGARREPEQRTRGHVNEMRPGVRGVVKHCQPCW